MAKLVFILFSVEILLYVVCVILSIIGYYKNTVVYVANSKKINELHDKVNMTFPCYDNLNAYVETSTTHPYAHFYYECTITSSDITSEYLTHRFDYDLFERLNQLTSLNKISLDTHIDGQFIVNNSDEDVSIDFSCIKIFRFGHTFKHAIVYLQFLPALVLIGVTASSAFIERERSSTEFRGKMCLYLLVDICRITFNLVYNLIIGFVAKKWYASYIDIYVACLNMCVLLLSTIVYSCLSSISSNRNMSSRKVRKNFVLRLYLTILVLVVSILFGSMGIYLNSNEVSPLPITRGEFQNFLNTPIEKKDVSIVYALICMPIILEINLYISRFLMNLI